MAPILSSLPPELVELIAKKSEPRDLLALRLVCKDLSLATFRHFSRTWFTKQSTNLSHQSLHNLKEVSRHEGLKYQVQNLVIRTGERNSGQGYTWYQASVGRLAAPLPGLDELRNSLIKLGNCTSFRIHRNEGPRDTDQTVYLTPGDAVAVLISAIDGAALLPNSFHVDFRDYDGFTGDVKQLYYRKYPFVTVWDHLQKLTIDFIFTRNNIDWAVGLVHCARNLEELKLVSCGGIDFELFINLLSVADTLPKLRKLGFLSVKIKVETLTRFLFRFRESIQELTHKSVELLDGDWVWDVYRKIHNNFPLLEYIIVGRHHTKTELEPESETS